MSCHCAGGASLGGIDLAARIRQSISPFHQIIGCSLGIARMVWLGRGRICENFDGKIKNRRQHTNCYMEHGMSCVFRRASFIVWVRDFVRLILLGD